MSNKIYLSRKSKPKGLCKICGQNKSDSQAEVQTNWFRGDDLVYNVHKDCFNEIGRDGFLNKIGDK